ncbi:MAG TPA: winged helix-turn-helix domain-containing protein [Solirubrobacteraceae bacterium]|jgi:hypothetical protein
MPPQKDVPPNLAHALADPVRIGLLTVLRDGPMGEVAIAARIGSDARTVARHARELVDLGFLAKRGRPPVYELVRAADFPDDIWEQLPTPVKKAATAATLAQIEATTEVAVDAGGFDRRDMHLTRTSMLLDEQGWAEVSADMLAFRAKLHEAHAQAAERLAAEAHPVAEPAQAVLMLFASPGVPSGVTSSVEPGLFTAEEGMERAFELQEAIEEQLASETPDWAAILGRVDELRVVVRAAASAERAGAEARVRSRER